MAYVIRSAFIEESKTDNWTSAEASAIAIVELGSSAFIASHLIEDDEQENWEIEEDGEWAWDAYNPFLRRICERHAFGMSFVYLHLI